ncbi:hypothetical protein RLOatenuis_8790 [Rickettsiales bacterium]|nr:hypothetical protein RLOatenuis_8790 [Rickettsiales bacterium]
MNRQTIKDPMIMFMQIERAIDDIFGSSQRVKKLLEKFKDYFCNKGHNISERMHAIEHFQVLIEKAKFLPHYKGEEKITKISGLSLDSPKCFEAYIDASYLCTFDTSSLPSRRMDDSGAVEQMQIRDGLSSLHL